MDIERTACIVTRGQQDAPSGLLFANDVASCRCAQDPILSDDQLLDAICRSDLCDQLDNFWVVVSAITSNHQKCPLCSFRDRLDDAGYEGFAVIRLLKHAGLFTKSRPAFGSAWLRRSVCVSPSRFTYVPGFWSVNGVNVTVCTLMMVCSNLCLV